MSFRIFKNREDFKNWLFTTNFNRNITLLQNHCTDEPSYDNFHNDNHMALLKGMENYHINSRKFNEIAQNITTFPDGAIAVCRSFETDPAGIKGANVGALCMEHLGSFMIGKDKMTLEHQETILWLNMILSIRFNLDVSDKTILYHHWYDRDTGKRTDGLSGNVKSCPGTNFFNGNTIEAAKQYFYPEMLKRAPAIYQSVSENCVKFLEKKGAINDTCRWTKASKEVNYLNILLTNIRVIWGKENSKYHTGVSIKPTVTVLEAIKFLANKKCISNSELWVEEVKKVKFLDLFFIDIVTVWKMEMSKKI